MNVTHELEQAEAIHRATINQLTVHQLDEFLDDLRKRRLEVVRKLETVAKVSANDAELSLYMRFEQQHKAALKLLDRLTKLETTTEESVNKLRGFALAMGADL